jgi:di/tricarboxylate transporter
VVGVLAVVLAAWCTAGLHGVDPALVAVAGAVAVCAPGRGGTRLDHALAEVPWHLVLFLAATTALGTALVSSGAAGWMGGSAFAGVDRLPDTLVVAVVVAVSLVAHLVVGSRSARAAVLVPMVIAVAASTGLGMTALVFASTIAAGYCLTLPVSAKPVAMFQHPFGNDGVTSYDVADLLRLSAVLVPVHLVLVTVFSVAVWPALGLPL